MRSCPSTQIAAFRREVACAMGHRPATAHEFFEKAEKKLLGSTRAQAIAIAVSLGIVAP
jgi:hypothetical protein